MVDAAAASSEPSVTELSKRRGYRAPGREKQKHATRRRILEAALQEFSRRGYDAASLRDIALEAEVSFAAIQKHFGTKEELWRAAIDEMFARQDAELDFGDTFRTDSLTTDDLREFIHRYVLYCARHPEHVRIIMHESLQDSNRVQWMAIRHTKRVHTPFARFLTTAMEQRLLPQAPILSMIYILAASAEMIFALGAEVKHVHGVDVQDPMVIKSHADAICAMFIRQT